MSGLLPHLLARQLPKSRHDGRQSGSCPHPHLQDHPHAHSQSRGQLVILSKVHVLINDSHGLFFQSMMSNQQLIPGMSSQQMQGGQVVKNRTRPWKKIFTLSTCREVEVAVLASSSSSRRPTRRRASSGKSQPALLRPPLTRYPIN